MLTSRLTQNLKTNEVAPVRVPEGVALVFTGTTLCGVTRAGALPDKPPRFAEDDARALTTVADYLSLTKARLTAAFTCLRTLPFDSVHHRRTTTLHRFPSSLSVMPANVRRVWKGALCLDGAPHVAFVVGEVKSLMDASSYMMVSGHLEPFGEIWRERLLHVTSELTATEAHVAAVGVRLIAERLVQGERKEIESRLVLAGLVGVSELACAGMNMETTRVVENNLSSAMLTVNKSLHLTRFSADVGIGSSVRGNKREVELGYKTKEGAPIEPGEKAVWMQRQPDSDCEQAKGIGRKLQVVAVTADGVREVTWRGW